VIDIFRKVTLEARVKGVTCTTTIRLESKIRSETLILSNPSGFIHIALDELDKIVEAAKALKGAV
jgi:hypothetical protein